jgi:hypothetical protein
MLSWALVVYGVTLAITGSRIAKPFRDWLTCRSSEAGLFVGCPMCVGFWVGFGSSFVLPEICPVHGASWYVEALGNGFASLALCWILHVVLTKLGAEDL